MLPDITPSPPSNIADNDALYLRIREGDESAIGEMIERNIPLVLSRVVNFRNSYTRFRHLNDDLVGEGLAALTNTVMSFAQSETHKPTGRIVFEVDCALGNYIDSEIGGGMVSSRGIRRLRVTGQPLPNRLNFDTHRPPPDLWNDNGREPLKQDGAETRFTPTRHDPKLRDRLSHQDITGETMMLDTILGCCECEEDEMIVQLRIKGYVDEEIASQMGISRRTVCARRQSIEQRFNECLQNDDQ